MISKLTSREFKNRLAENTKEGDLKIIGSPLAVLSVFETGKSFYGTYNDNSFELTKSSIMYQIPYILKGSYHSDNFKLNISYNWEPMWFRYMWIRVFPIIAAIGSNLLLIYQEIQKNVNVPAFIYLIVNGFFITGYLFILFVIKKRKDKFEKEFRKILEVVD